ncbi:alpha-amylase family protein [Paenibacillus cymbidii]|uniref:alpha-amylase family protein n=1 Tax=Paenibacillus cymbidii TaxID=1639034 RepID=UPI001436B2E1|nr:alpha-amylase family protein [Paenibacillus cymbidii]
MNPELTSRKIHLDFHTPHWVEQVGQSFDAERLVQTWKQARVNAVTAVFGYCACGNAYYEGAAGQQHPGLQQDMLTPLLAAAKREQIQIYVHFSTGIHDRAVLEHPEWAMQRKDGSRLDTDGGRSWGWPCFNSPFVEEWFWPQLRDFVPRFPDVAGIFLDMVMYPADTCYCSYCRQKAAALGLDLNRREEMERFERLTLDTFMAQTKTLIQSLDPQMAFTSNNQWYIGGARSEYLDFIELEAPVSWNSYHYPIVARYIRTLPKPSGGMTTRFPKNWGYFGSLNNETQLKFECATILATLGACCVGDQLHPSGKPDEGVYELIGDAYAFVQEREAWALNAQSVPYLGILADDQRNCQIRSAPADYFAHQTPEALYGAGLALLEGNRHFDVLDRLSELAPYRLLWLAENRTLDTALIPAIRAYVAGGGKLLVTGSELWRNAEWRLLLEELAGVKLADIAASPGIFVKPGDKLAAGIPQVPYFVKSAYARLLPGSGAEVAAELILPYENIDPSRRFGHYHAPAGEPSGNPAAVIGRYGAGAVCVAPLSLAEDYFSVGSRHIRQLVLSMIDELLPAEERLLEVAAHSPAVEVSLMRQEQKNRWVLHLVQYGAKRHTGNTVIEELPLRRDIPVRVRLAQRPAAVYAAPSRQPLDWTWTDGVLETIVPELHIHQMVVMEL